MKFIDLDKTGISPSKETRLKIGASTKKRWKDSIEREKFLKSRFTKER